MSLKLNASAVYGLRKQRLSDAFFPVQNWSSFDKTQNFVLRFKTNQSCRPNQTISCAMNIAAGLPDDPGKFNINRVMDKVRIIWNSSPQPVKSFPWSKTLENFTQLILDLFLIIVKYLSIPLFAITSISEMSYCAHERKLYLIPFPVLLGVALANVLRDLAMQSSPYLKNAEVPWHLISILIIFALLKFPGPYYPYWGRMFIPHLANGVITRILWFMLQWYRKPQKSSQTISTFSTTTEST